MVFYRKYRPQKIEEIDSEIVRERILSVLSKKQVPHAFLFTGPKGLGKTSTARIIAKVVNCETTSGKKQLTSNKSKKVRSQKPEARSHLEPCNKCNQCISITQGTNLDVIEIDAASNRGIDEIRDLREKIRLSPIAGSYKVYIIDEVHMLTTEAFNALLKTLEEPPPHALFVLCTTEPHKVPATIVSRCFHIAFPLANERELKRSFQRIIKGEKLKVEDEAVDYIARLSEGSFRDGAKILEELSLKAGKKKISKQIVEKKFNVSSLQLIITDLRDALFNRDTKTSLQQVQKLVDQGIDMRYAMEQLINHFHYLLLVELEVVKGSTADYHNLKEFKKRGEEVEIAMKELVMLLTRASAELKYAVLPQLPLELAIVEWCQKEQNNADQRAEQRGEEFQRNSASSSASFSDRVRVKRSNDETIDILQKLIEQVKPYNHSVAGVLRGCSVKSYDGKKLVIETGYKFHKERLEEKEIQKLLEKVAEEMNGKRVQVSVILKE